MWLRFVCRTCADVPRQRVLLMVRETADGKVAVGRGRSRSRRRSRPFVFGPLTQGRAQQSNQLMQAAFKPSWLANFPLCPAD